jgi:hypothetical protein
VATQNVKGRPTLRKGRKARRNIGKYRVLERSYWAGSLTTDEEQRFERLVYEANRLYKEVRG